MCRRSGPKSSSASSVPASSLLLHQREHIQTLSRSVRGTSAPPLQQNPLPKPLLELPPSHSSLLLARANPPRSFPSLHSSSRLRPPSSVPHILPRLLIQEKGIAKLTVSNSASNGSSKSEPSVEIDSSRGSSDGTSDLLLDGLSLELNFFDDRVQREGVGEERGNHDRSWKGAGEERGERKREGEGKKRD